MKSAAPRGPAYRSKRRHAALNGKAGERSEDFCDGTAGANVSAALGCQKSPVGFFDSLYISDVRRGGHGGHIRRRRGWRYRRQQRQHRTRRRSRPRGGSRSRRFRRGCGVRRCRSPPPRTAGRRRRHRSRPRGHSRSRSRRCGCGVRQYHSPPPYTADKWCLQLGGVRRRLKPWLSTGQAPEIPPFRRQTAFSNALQFLLVSSPLQRRADATSIPPEALECKGFRNFFFLAHPASPHL